jgi:leucyl/phenylalanyl-tRNA--protein transferase
MGDLDGNLNWYYPEIRTIIPLDDFNIPRSLKKFMKSSSFKYKYDFETITVIKQCAYRDKTWITDELIDAYSRLENLGFVHSVSVFLNNRLVGGLYGIAFKGAFFGESMFSHVSQASKTALVKLIRRLNEKKFVLLDVQFQNKHLKMFGAIEISLDDFNKILSKAYNLDVSF